MGGTSALGLYALLKLSVYQHHPEKRLREKREGCHLPTGVGDTESWQVVQRGMQGRGSGAALRLEEVHDGGATTHVKFCERCEVL